METEMITMLVELQGWTESEIARVAKAERVSTWRDCDLYVREGPAHVSLDVIARSHTEARAEMRSVFGPLPPSAFLAST
jgi:hypothetical protein